MAWVIKALSGWARVQFKGMADADQRWNPVLSREELRLWATEAGLFKVTEAQLQRAELAVSRAPRQPIPPALQGGLLRITAAERDVCRFWTVQAIDETLSQRRQRKAAEKRLRDRVCKAAKDEAARQAGIRKPRDQYQAECAAQREREAAFCREHSITLRTLQRWKQKGNPRVVSLVADIGRSPTPSLNDNIERPNLRHSGSGRCCIRSG